MDRYNYISPGRVKVLVVPINGCDEDQFQAYYKQIRSCDEVRLLDITPMTELKHFNPQTSPNGRLIYEYDIVVPDNESIFLHDFEPYRKTFIVLGVGKYTNQNLEHYQQLNKDLKKEFPSTIIQSCIIFDTPEEKVKQFNPKTDHSIKSYLFHNESILLESLICDVSRNFLFHLDDYVSSYSNITLRSPVSITDSQLLSKTISKAQKRLSSGSSLKVSFSSNNLSPAELKGSNQVRHNGRQSKLLASFYLLAGKYVEAMNNFSDALLYLKKSEDYMWLGSALEGLGVAIVLMNYSNITYQLPNAILASILHLLKSKIRDMSIDNTVNKRVSSENLSPNGNGRLLYNGNGSKILSPRTSSSSGVSFNLPIGAAPDLNAIAVPELVKQLQDKSNYYFQSSANDFENTVPDLVYIESILRYLHFMIHVFRNGSNINGSFFETLVKNLPPKPDTITNPWYNKNNILNELDKIFSLQLVDLNLIDQCRIYSRLSLIYNDLNLFRKKAFMLRILIVAILPQLESQPNETSDSIVTQITNTFDASTIRSIIIELFNIYQINKQPELKSDDSYENTSSNWNSMQLSLIKLSIKVFENLKDFEALSSIFCLSLTRYLHCLPIDDEYRIREKMIENVRNYGTRIPYPDPYLLRGMRLINNKAQDELVPFSEFHGTEIGEATPAQTPNPSNSLFVFDPFNKPVSKSIDKDKLIIKHEIYQMKVQLQNPYSFEIEVNDIEIVSNLKTQTLRSGIRTIFNTNRNQSKVSLNNPKIRLEKPSTPSINDFQSSQLTIPPKSIETFIVPFKPLVPGNLTIEGCKIKIGACETRFFPIVNEEYNETLTKLKDYQQFEGPKLGDGFEVQDPLQTIMTNLKENKVLHRVECLTIDLNVLDPQPTLSLLNLLATNGWLMLLEGEKHEFSIDLMNQSNQPINYLSFSFWDSTIQNLTKKLSTSSLGVNINAFEMYELEWYLYKFKTFKILNKKEINEKYKPIKANGEIEIKYEITGKKNMTDLKMILEYGNKLNDLTKCFVKNIEIPLKVTVLPSIELINFDIMPLFLSSLNGLMKSQSNANLSNLKLFIDNLKDNISDYCLIFLDMRNSWKETLMVDIKFEEFQIKEAIKPNTVSRFLIPMKRISTGDHDFTKIIPSIRNKQYIKDYLITESEDMEMRQSFWLRNLILDKIQGSWNFNHRQGIIDFRNIRLNTKMVNYVIYPKIKILHEIWNEHDEMIKRTGSQFLLNTGEFYNFKTIITNYDTKPLDGVIRHLPFPIINNSINHNLLKEQSMDKKIIINGVLQSKLPQTINPGKSLSMDLSFVILENGEFEWGSLLDIIEDENSYKITAREPVYIVASA